MNGKKLMVFDEIVLELRRLSWSHATGTLFVTSSDNRAIGFVLEQGCITACGYGHHRGLQALGHFQTIETGTCSFSDKISTFLKMGEYDLPETRQIFHLLGHTDYETPADAALMVEEQPSEPEQPSLPPRFYRGNLVEELPEQEQPHSAPKSPRIYRGNVIKD